MKLDTKEKTANKLSLPIVVNWNNKDEGHGSRGIYEYPMYADVGFVSELRGKCGPYSIINSIPFHVRPGKVQVAGFLRVEYFGHTPDLAGSTKTVTDAYHGGTLSDEVCALASLILGVRLRAGDCTRTFGVYASDPLGSPRAPFHGVPTIFRRNESFIVPCVTSNTPDLSDLSKLSQLQKLTTSQSISLMRAARLYQDALWIVESEPELAWIMLVSALESGAVEWVKKDASPVELLKSVKGDFAIKLEEKGIDCLELVAEEIANILSSTAKFKSFCKEFLPSPPLERPYTYQQIDWTEAGLLKILNTIYKHRSSALHAGTPFPRPMCQPPYRNGPDSPPSERGSDGIAHQTLGASWQASDLPVSLNTFVQLTRNILLAWWGRMAEDSDECLHS